MRIFLAIIFFCCSLALPAQVLAPDYPDQIYIPPTHPNIINPKNAYLQRYFLPQLLQASEKKNLSEKISLQRNNFLKPPIDFPDCVYFNSIVQHCTDSLGNFNLFNNYFPPSLRFSTDSTLNNIDSLSSINLFPKVALENYTQSFYFRKFEVTNAEYWEFVHYVIDSVAKRILSEDGFEDSYEVDKTQWESQFDFDTTDWYFANIRPLTNEKMHWDAISSDYTEALAPIYLPSEERFYKRKEIDTRKLNYEYYCDTNGVPLPYLWYWKKGGDQNRVKNIVNVYPDTLCWVHDFSWAECGPMTNMYFWHPAFASYPVVGISYEQAKAFLHWKTLEEQKKLDAKKINIKVQYDLPSEIEWETAATSVLTDGKLDSYGKNCRALADNNWATDLMLDSSALVNEKQKVVIDSTAEEIPDSPPSNQSGIFDYGVVDGLYTRENHRGFLQYSDTTIERNGKKFEVKTTYYYWSAPRTNFLNENTQPFDPKHSPDSYIFTAPSNLLKVGKTSPGDFLSLPLVNGDYRKRLPLKDNSQILTQVDPLGISFLGGNVSEWLNEDYSDWRHAFVMRLSQLHSIYSVDAQMEYQRESYFDKRNAKNGKLVRGSNWFDERYSALLGKNPEGANAKCFVDPAKDHSTLGFRYVIRISKK